MKKRFFSFSFLFVTGIITAFAQTPQINNIIIMIPDGTSIDVLALARWYNNGKPLAIDPYIRGLVKTHCSDTPIGDSAPTGSTYATGHLSRTGFVSTYPDSVMSGYDIIATDSKKAFSPMFTVLEAAKLQGKSTGLVVTCHFPHATPADFSSHSQHRDNYDLLSRQMVYNNIDVVFGGGYSYLKPDKRADKLDLTKVLSENGTSLIRTPKEMIDFNGSKVWGLFAPKALKNDLDRNADKEPSLADMTQKALSILSKNPKGFFMMVEGSKVDWAAHDNDPVGMVTEYLAFDKAVGAAINFAKSDGHTLVIVVPDHGNSGISIGNARSSDKYDKLTLKELMYPLINAKNTAEAIEEFIDSNSTNEQIKDVFFKRYGVNNLASKELDSLRNYFSNKKLVKQGLLKKNNLNIQKLTASIISSRTYIGFTTVGHTGEDVFIAIFDPRNNAPTGLIKNDEVNFYMQKALNNTNLDSLTNLYFVNQNTVFQGFHQKIDSSDVNNKVLIVENNNKTIRIPANKNIVEISGKEQKFPTLMIYNGFSFFVPQSLRTFLEK
ncbi:MAG: alkaline phosphatase [Bacteroidota bacterium]